MKPAKQNSGDALPGTDKSMVGRIVLAGAAGGVIGIAIVWGDRSLNELLSVEITTVDAARTMISGMLGGIITVAVFSLWMRTVVVGLVSDQFSPRTMTVFLSDRFQHRMLAVMASAVVIQAVLLIGLNGEPEDPAPPLTLFISLTVTLMALSGVLLAIRQATKALSLPEIVRELTDNVLAVLEKQLASDDVHWVTASPDAIEAHSTQTGWVTQVDSAALAKTLPPNATVHLRVRTGDFLTPRRIVATISLEHGYEDLDLDAIAATVHLGRTRDTSFDLALALGQLVDVAAHALSGGKDTATAHEALVHIGAALEAITASHLGPAHYQDDDDRVILDDMAWTARDHVRMVARRLRGMSSQEPITARHLVQTFGFLRKTAVEVEDADVIEEVDHQLQVLLDLAEHHGMADHELTQLRELAGFAFEAGVDDDNFEEQAANEQ